MPKDQYMCQLCSNHGHYNQPKKGHKQNCPNRNCTCQLCSLNVKRRVLDQIERQWRLNKEKKRLMKKTKNVIKSNDFEEGEAICHMPSSVTTEDDNIFAKTIQMENGRAKMEMAQKRQRRHAFHSIELLLAKAK